MLRVNLQIKSDLTTVLDVNAFAKVILDLHVTTYSELAFGKTINKMVS